MAEGAPPAGGRAKSAAGASVVIPSHGGAHHLARTLPPLLEDPATREVVVVADRDPRVRRAVEAFADPAVRCVDCDAGNENGAREAGVAAACAEIVVVLDDDVLPGPSLVGRHLAHRHDRRVVLGYMPVAPTLLRGVGRFPARIYEDNYQEAVSIWERSVGNVLDLFWAGNFSARREDLLAVGIENTAYRGRYHADNDLGIRLKEAGFEGAFDRAAAAVHLYEAGARAYVRDCRRQGAARAHLKPPVAAPTPIELATSRLCLAGVYVAGALRNRRAERHLLWRLRLIEQRAGAYSAQQGRAEAEGLLQSV